MLHDAGLRACAGADRSRRLGTIRQLDALTIINILTMPVAFLIFRVYLYICLQFISTTIRVHGDVSFTNQTSMRKFQIGEKVRYQGCSGLIKRVYADGANPDQYDVVVTTFSGAFAVPRVSGTWLDPAPALGVRIGAGSA
jgi:hypothetical protein